MSQDLETIAKLIGLCAYNAYHATLVGSPAPVTRHLYDRLNDVQVGDWIVETSTILMCRSGRRSALNAVGQLIKVTQEPFAFSDPDFVWDEVEEGRPHPTERCTYIRTLDGREFRWTNASFISVPAEWPLRVPEDVGRKERVAG